MEGILKDMAKPIPPADLYTYIGTYFPPVVDALLAGPSYIEVWFEHAKQWGWECGGKIVKMGELTLWDFWKYEVDLNNLQVLYELDKNVEAPASGATSNTLKQTASPKKRTRAKKNAKVKTVEDIKDGYKFQQKEDLEVDSDSKDKAVDKALPNISDANSGQEGGQSDSFNPVGAGLEHAMFDKRHFLDRFQLQCLPALPTTDRELLLLQLDTNIWNYSSKERASFVEYVEDHAKRHIDEGAIASFEVLRKRHDEARANQKEAEDNVGISGNSH